MIFLDGPQRTAAANVLKLDSLSICGRRDEMEGRGRVDAMLSATVQACRYRIIESCKWTDGSWRSRLGRGLISDVSILRRQKIAELLISVSHVGVPRCALYRKSENLGKNGWVGGAGSGAPRAAKSGQPANPFLLNPPAQSLAHASTPPVGHGPSRCCSSSGPCWPVAY